MTSDRTTTASDRLSAVTDVSGEEPDLRAKVARTGADAEVATAALRDAIAELHRSDDEAWRRYAIDLEEATRRFDTTVGLATARLRAERATSKDDLGIVVDDVMATWRSRADELRVQAHIGQMDVRDFVTGTVDELDLAGQRLGAVVALLRSGVGETLSSLRDEVTDALDDAGRIFQGVTRP